MATFIDRRLDGKNKSTVNRQRFIRRFKGQIKKAGRGHERPQHHRHRQWREGQHPCPRPVRAGRTQWRGRAPRSHSPGQQGIHGRGSRKRPQGGGGGGSGGGQASNSGEGEDEFVFELSREEFLEMFFEDLEPPNLVRTSWPRPPNSTGARRLQQRRQPGQYRRGALAQGRDGAAHGTGRALHPALCARPRRNWNSYWPHRRSMKPCPGTAGGNRTPAGAGRGRCRSSTPFDLRYSNRVTAAGPPPRR